MPFGPAAVTGAGTSVYAVERLASDPRAETDVDKAPGGCTARTCRTPCYSLKSRRPVGAQSVETTYCVTRAVATSPTIWREADETLSKVSRGVW
jgi:hypothetical protein